MTDPTSSDDDAREPDLVERKIRPIQGRGVFSLRDFARGLPIKVLPTTLAPGKDRHTIQIDDEHHDVGEPRRYLNHSCAANSVVEYHRKQLRLVATRGIAPVDVMAIDYYQLQDTTSDRFECRCPVCVG
jgi:hypothetical protein